MRMLAFCAALASVVACGGAGPAALLSDARILVPGVGVTATDCRTQICPHNENTDLIAWKGAIWLVHRTAMSQVLGPNSALHVYRSGDGARTFQHVARIEAPADRDLRDPHFYLVGDVLHVKALTRLPVTSARDADVDTITVLTTSSDGAIWTPLKNVAPKTWSLWRVVKGPDGAYYSAAYEDGDKSVVLFKSSDGASWSAGPLVYGVAADTPLETELIFTPRPGKEPLLVALVRVDGGDYEYLGTRGYIRTKVCTADAPYAAFGCGGVLDGQRLDGPVATLWNGRLYVVARKHLGESGRKRTALFDVALDASGKPTGSIAELAEFPSAGDTAYAGLAPIGGNRFAVTWYSSDLRQDPDWVTGMLGATDIWAATLDLGALPKR